MKTARILLFAGLMPALAVGTSAAEMKRGASLLAIQITQGDGDYVFLPSYVTFVNRQPELGVQAQYWFFLRDDYAVNLSAGIGYYKEVNAPNSSALPGIETQKLTNNSWQVRLGGDRFGSVGERLEIFAGPGIHLWGGRSKFEPGPDETETVLRYAIDGRLGARIKLGQSFGLIGQFGHYWGYARVEQLGGETKWLASGTNGGMGFAFAF